MPEKYQPTIAAPRDAGPGYRVDDLVVDTGCALVTRSGTEVPLPKLSFDLLLALIEAAPRIVTTDELMERVWPGLVVSPETISQRVKLLRGALDDDPKQPRYIASVRSRGYRLIAPVAPLEEAGNRHNGRIDDVGVRQVENAAEPVRTFEVLPAEPPGIAERLRGMFAHLASPPVRRTAVGVTALVAALLMYGWYVGGWQARETSAIRPAEPSLAATGPPPRSVAVLPFDSAPDSEVLALGISETVLHQLGNLRELVVIASTSSFAFRGENKDAREIGRKLNVRYLLEGNVQSDQQRLRVTARLVDATTGAQLWSIRHDKTLQDIFTVEDEIALEVARALELSLDASAKAKLTESGTTSFDAYLAFLQARTLLASLRVSEMKLAIEQLDRAIQIDPNFAPAYVTLASALVLLAEYEVTDDRQVRFEAAVERGKSLLNKALALDSGNGNAYVERGYLTAFTDLTGAEADYRRGLELSPNYARGYEGLAAVLFEDPTRRGEALAMLDRARQLDPLEPRHDVSKSLFLFYGRGQVREPGQLLVNVLGRDPRYQPALMRLSEMRVYQGQFAESAKYAEQALSLDPLSESPRTVLVTAYLDVGDVAAALKVIDEARHPLEARWIPVHLYRHDWRRAGEAAYAAALNDTLSPMTESMAVAAIRLHARATGDYARARKVLEEISGVTWDDDGRPTLPERIDMQDNVVALADMLRASGEETRAKRLLEAALAEMDYEARQLERGDLWYFGNRAMVQALLGNTDTAIETLQQLVAARPDCWWYIFEIEPAYTDLRTDPRFKSLLATARAHAAKERQRLAELRTAGLVPVRSGSAPTAAADTAP
jgi:TolB-like protein/DNA-binding winged helix-turn-helix (wHTH) protein